MEILGSTVRYAAHLFLTLIHVYNVKCTMSLSICHMSYMSFCAYVHRQTFYAYYFLTLSSFFLPFAVTVISSKKRVIPHGIFPFSFHEQNSRSLFFYNDRFSIELELLHLYFHMECKRNHAFCSPDYHYDYTWNLGIWRPRN